MFFKKTYHQITRTDRRKGQAILTLQVTKSKLHLRSDDVMNDSGLGIGDGRESQLDSFLPHCLPELCVLGRDSVPC